MKVFRLSFVLAFILLTAFSREGNAACMNLQEFYQVVYARPGITERAIVVNVENISLRSLTGEIEKVPLNPARLSELLPHLLQHREQVLDKKAIEERRSLDFKQKACESIRVDDQDFYIQPQSGLMQLVLAKSLGKGLASEDEGMIIRAKNRAAFLKTVRRQKIYETKEGTYVADVTTLYRADKVLPPGDELNVSFYNLLMRAVKASRSNP